MEILTPLSSGMLLIGIWTKINEDNLKPAVSHPGGLGIFSQEWPERVSSSVIQNSHLLEMGAEHMLKASFSQITGNAVWKVKQQNKMQTSVCRGNTVIYSSAHKGISA